MVTGYALSQHPVEASEVRRLAEQYNTALLRSLERPPQQRVVKTALRLEVAPFASPRGGGVLVTTRF